MKSLSAGVFVLGAVITLAQCGCSHGSAQTNPTLNESAALVGELPGNPMQWRVITSTINHTDSTMSTLFGNDVAVNYARSHSQPDFPTGSVLCLVTWTQRDDARWFGARIPDQAKSAEYLTVAAEPDGKSSYSYDDYEGSPLKKVLSQQAGPPNDRTTFIVGLRAAVLP